MNREPVADKFFADKSFAMRTGKGYAINGTIIGRSGSGAGEIGP
jgi:hypothetical protein